MCNPDLRRTNFTPRDPHSVVTFLGSIVGLTVTALRQLSTALYEVDDE